jgi:N-acetylmuramoyl-L-alanine amidase
MIKAALLAAFILWPWPGAAPARPPASIVVATARGEARVAVSVERGHPALPAPPLSGLLPLEVSRDGDWATVAFAGHPFRFLLDAPVVGLDGRLVPLVGGAYVARDTLFLPLQWLTAHVPAMFREAYRWDPVAARFEDARMTPVVRHTTPSAIAAEVRPASEAARTAGLRMAHKVVVDAGHGGRDAGTVGLRLPRGVQEKHVALAIAQKLRTELEARGIDVLMTRTTDTLINLFERAPMCRADCDLFVSIHVNSLEPRRGYESVSGLETYFLSEARTADARRVAAVENAALRYEMDAAAQESALDFILKDLHTNEYLRESAQLAEFVQRLAQAVHPGERRHVSQAGFAVLGTARRPAILVETGFGTNRTDAGFISSPDGQKKLAAAIADGIVAYLKHYESKILAESGP